MRNKNKVWGIVSAALSALSFGLCPTVCKFAYRYTWTGVSLTCLATAIAAILIFIYTRIKKIPVKLEKNEIVPMLGAGILNFIGILSYNIAAGMIPGGTVAALNYLYPALVLITSFLFFAYKCTAIRILSAVLNVGGVLFFFEKADNMLMGCILGVLSAVFYGAYSMAVEHTTLEKMNTFKLGFYTTGLSAIFCALTGIFTGQLIFPAQGPAYFWAFALGFTSNVLGVLFFQSAVQNIGASQTSLTATLELLVSIVLGVLLFAEPINWKVGTGCVLIMAGIALNAISTMKSEEVEEKIIYLTFDGAPHPPRTQELLRVCEEFGIKATFFMEGHRLEQEPLVARMVVDAGHSVGNHSYSHTDLLELPLEKCIWEIEKTDELMEKELHLKTSLVRPPNGHISDEFAKYLEDHGRKVVVWSISVKDWTGPDAKALAKRTISLLKDPVITMVFHDFVEWNPEALRIIIPEAIKLGYTFKAYDMML